MTYDLDWINDRQPNIDYSSRDTSMRDDEHYTRLFEGRLKKKFEKTRAEDIGGIMVYSTKGQVVAVYDYENYCGWWA